MNSYERVIKALELEQPDRVPLLEWSLNPEVTSQIEKKLTVQEFMAKHLDVVSTYWVDEEQRSSDSFTDEWGIKRKFLGQDYGIPYEHPIKSEQDLENYSPPDPLEDERLRNLEELVDRYKGEKAIAFLLETVFTYAWGLVGMEEFFKLIIKKPTFAKKLLEVSFKYFYKLAQEAIDIGADIIFCGDDLAYKKGLMLSIDDFNEFLAPYYSQIIDLTNERDGVYFVKHSDGNIWDLIRPFIDMGADGINPLEPTANMDIEQVKHEFGDEVCLIGNIDCSDLLSRGTPKEVRKVVQDTIEKASPAGGYILASSNEIHSAVKPENFTAMIEATKEFGQY